MKTPKLKLPYLGQSDPLLKPLVTYRTSSDAFKDADYGCAVQVYKDKVSWSEVLVYLLVVATACWLLFVAV